MKKTLEVIASTYNDAKNSFDGGASRIELVSALSEGGLTPSIGLIKQIGDNLALDMAVMLRPNSNSFVYDQATWQTMRLDLEAMEKAGVTRVVVGALDASGKVAYDELCRLTDGIKLKYTFHRAIDASSDIMLALDTVSKIPNFTHVLSSGGPGKAVENLPVLQEMIQKSPLTIVVGSGVTLDNIKAIQDSLDVVQKPYDLHLGTALRTPSTAFGAVDAALVKKASLLVT